MTWKKSEVNGSEVRELSRRFEVDLLTATILSRRCLTSPRTIRFFLENDVHLLHNPFLMEAMAEAVGRINAAVESGERILIFGDRDVDGITSTVLLFEALKEMGAEVSWMLPEGEETYGLSMKVIEKVAQAETGLLITVDCGVSNMAEIDFAASLGIETIVVDHHNPPAELPRAFAIINPKLSGSAYPFRDLCGCAVASKVEWALRFSQSPFFGASFCLLNVRPANDTVVFEAVRLVNLAETARISENIVPGMVAFEKTRLAAFIAESSAGGELIVHDAAAQARLVGRAFSGLELPLSDITPLVRELMPALAGKSLLKIQQSSRSARYAERSPAEIDTLVELFTSLVLIKEKPLIEPAFKRLDLVSLGTLADLMPLTNENRILVKQGLAAIGRFERSGLRQVFMRKDLLGKRIGTMEIAWQIAPLLNSAGRMGEPGKATELFLSKTEEEIDKLVNHLFALDTRRKSMGEASWILLLDQARESFERTGGRLVLVSERRIQRGITGIMASRLQGFFKVPAIVIAVGEDVAAGSIRSTRERLIEEFFGRFGGSFSNFGGHDFAGGFTLPSANIDTFLADFFQRIEEIEPAVHKEDAITIDAEIPISYLTPDLQKVVDFFEPYGEANPPLAFLTRGLRIAQCDLIGRKEANHLKLLLEAGKLKWPAVYWNAASRFPGEFAVGDTVDLVYRLGRNAYGGSENLQLTILDLSKC